MLMILAVVGTLLAILPLAVAVANRRWYRPLPEALPVGDGERVAVLIPARNEVANIGACLESVLADPNPNLRVWVLDDHSEDGTGDVVRMLAARDARLKLLEGQPLPEEWGGKMWACHQLSEAAMAEGVGVLLFVDADVQLEVGAAGRAAAALADPKLGLASGVPKQLSGNLGERWLVHHVVLVLLGYLPMWFLPTPRPSVAAGCGQFMAFSRKAYAKIGGHATVPESLHDGLHLARLARRAGYRTGLFNLTDAATCRMYRTGAEAWRGFRKNAHLGMATPVGLPVWSLLLLGGHVLPWGVFGVGILAGNPGAVMVAWVGIVANIVLRVRLVVTHAQPWRLVWEHPLAVAYAFALQIDAFVRYWLGQRPEWKGRKIS